MESFEHSCDEETVVENGHGVALATTLGKGSKTSSEKEAPQKRKAKGHVK